MRLIHYGSDRYDPAEFVPISNKGWHKPDGGLWTSPVESTWGWADWCRSEQFSELTKAFEVEFTGTLYVVDNIADMHRLPWIDDRAIDFEALARRYDGLHLTVKGQERTRFTAPRSLYGWDCETVLVFNPHSLAQVETTLCA